MRKTFHFKTDLTAKLLLPLVLACAGLALCSTTVLAQAGHLDPTFGNGGIFVLPGSNSFATSVAIQSDGKILVAGQVQTSTGGSPAVLRLTSNGALDTSFGKSGIAVLNIPKTVLANSVIVQSDGKIVLGISSAGADAAPILELTRFAENGTLDSSFGSSGVAQLLRSFQSSGPQSTVLAQQPDGKILLGGGSLLVRTNSDGSLDPGFGQNGFATLVSLGAVTVLPNGQILVGANRYNANGSLDTSFGILGRTAGLAGISPARLQSTGKIVAVGSVVSKVVLGQLPNFTVDTGFGLMRYNPNGSVDTTFGHQGGVITDFSSFAPFATPSDMVVELNGDIIVAGQVAKPGINAFTPGPAFFALARYTSSGQLDTTFGFGGKVVTSFGVSTAGISAITLDSDGRIVAAGNTGGITVARYLTQ